MRIPVYGVKWRLDMLVLMLLGYWCTNYTNAGIGAVSALLNKCNSVGLVGQMRAVCAVEKNLVTSR
eukprot:2838300-Ditylum_brightwellii.AAC.1